MTSRAAIQIQLLSNTLRWMIARRLIPMMRQAAGGWGEAIEKAEN